MDVPLSEFTTLDLERELYAFGLETEGTKQERYERLLAARQSFNQPLWRPRRAAIATFGARVQLEDFAEIRKFKQNEYDFLAGRVDRRVERVRRAEDGEGLEYYHPEAIGSIDRSQTYLLNMEEFMVRQEPYVHKIFVIFITSTNGQMRELCYARSLAKLRSWDEHTEEFEYPLMTSENMNSEDAQTGRLQTTVITADNIAKALCYILTEIRAKGLTNFVAIVCDQFRLNMHAVMQLLAMHGLTLLPCIADIRDLQKVFRNMYCSASVRCSTQLTHEIYTRSNYGDQLNRICSSNSTKNMNAMLSLIDFVNRLSDILSAMWQHAYHQDKPICLLGVNNKALRIYAGHVKRELPPITFEDCAAGAGLLQLLVFDALWCLSNEEEPAHIEQNYADPTLFQANPQNTL